MKDLLRRSIDELADLLTRIDALQPALLQLGQTLMSCWSQGGKVLTAGNGGSAADAMHLAEELVVRFHKNRKALAAISLTDPTVLTCCANDFSFEQVFSRQIEALGNPGDVFLGFTTSGNSPNIVRAVETARQKQLTTVAFLGKDGGALRGRCDIELLVPANNTARIQEAHQLLFHVLCEWIDSELTR